MSFAKLSIWRSWCCQLGRNTYDFHGKSANAQFGKTQFFETPCIICSYVSIHVSLFVILCFNKTEWYFVDSTNILCRMIFFMVYVFGGFPLVWTMHYSICVYDECQQCPEGFLWIRPCQLNRLLSKYNLLRRTSLKTNFSWIELSTHPIHDMDSTFML